MKTLKGDPIFPLRIRPTQSDWTKKGNPKVWSPSFGAFRPGDRIHAACDLLVPEDTQVVAVADGTVIDKCDKYFRNLWAVTVMHDGFIVLYGEVNPANGVEVNQTVLKGNTIAYVGNQKTPQLHFELYLNEDNKPRQPLLSKDALRLPHTYCRALNPEDSTPYLQEWLSNLVPAAD
jgi:murein DD-endopeptidase MepM/ murein hydrolase activator NlpD